MSPAEGRFTLGLLAMDGAMPSCYTGVMDLLKIAQKLAHLRDPATKLRLESVLVGARGQATISLDGGLVIGPVHSPDRALDLLLVPGYMHASVHDALERVRGYGPEIELLRALSLRGVPLAANCCGSLLLAEAGLLDGHEATTSWWLDGAFRSHYPRVRLDARLRGPYLPNLPGSSVAGLLRALERAGSPLEGLDERLDLRVRVEATLGLGEALHHGRRAQGLDEGVGVLNHPGAPAMFARLHDSLLKTNVGLRPTPRLGRSRPSTLRRAQGRPERSRGATSSGRPEPVEGRGPHRPAPLPRPSAPLRASRARSRDAGRAVRGLARHAAGGNEYRILVSSRMTG